MVYIVLDLEWNQPVSFESSVFKKVGDQLLFELIQIGAVKLDERMQIIDAISLPIKPTHYIKIHPRIQRLTQLSKDDFAKAPCFLEAMDMFANWCGEEYALITWGDDDTSVLQQNIDFFGWKGLIPPLCDLQHYFSDLRNYGKERKGLKYAMELFNIFEEERLNFHNALNDAYYTAQVFQKMPSPEKIVFYTTAPKVLVHGKKDGVKTRFSLPHMATSKLFRQKKLSTPPCPYCKKATCLSNEYIDTGKSQYIALANCKDHGELFVQVKVRCHEAEDQIYLKMAKATAKNKAYIAAKQLEVQDDMGENRTVSSIRVTS